MRHCYLWFHGDCGKIVLFTFFMVRVMIVGCFHWVFYVTLYALSSSVVGFWCGGITGAMFNQNSDCLVMVGVSSICSKVKMLWMAVPGATMAIMVGIKITVLYMNHCRIKVPEITKGWILKIVMNYVARIKISSSFLAYWKSRRYNGRHIRALSNAGNFWSKLP